MLPQWYRLIMEAERNPLRNLPPAQRFQLMIFLSVMWTTIFTASTTLWVWYGELITGSTFRLASGVTRKVSSQIRFKR